MMFYEESGKQDNIFHKGFKIGILLKGIDGVIEILGGILLVFLNPNSINDIVTQLIQDALLGNHMLTIINFILKLESSFSLSSQHFFIFYLTSHGIIKLFFVIILCRKKTWAYPLTIISLLLFILYQMHHYMISSSIWLIILTIFDVVMIILTLLEYKSVKSRINKF